jgi:CheY-like chemotaxis protein
MSERILLADNLSPDLRHYKEFLEKEGYEVLAVDNPTEARRVIEQGEVELAILDLRLKDDRDLYDISGLTVAKETSPEIPKIIFTGFEDFPALREALDKNLEGLPTYINFAFKSEGEEGLLRAVRKALRFKSRSFRATQADIAAQLDEDYRAARHEARRHAWAALGVSLIGAGFIFAGIVLALKQALEIGIVSAVGGLVIEIMNYLFFSRVDKAHERVDRYHDELLQTRRLENLLAACDKLSAQRREECLAHIVRAATRGWIGAPAPLDVRPEITSADQPPKADAVAHP